MKEKEILENLKKGISKKVLPTALAGTLLFGSGVLSTNADANGYSLEKPISTYEDYLKYDGIKIFVDGRYVEFNNDLGYPISVNGRTYIPVRIVAETFGANVYWYKEENTAWIVKGIERVDVKVGSNKIVYKPDTTDIFHRTQPRESKMDAKPFFHNNRTYVPVRAIFENFGCDVNWDQNTKTITIKSKLNLKNVVFRNPELSLDTINPNEYTEVIYDGNKVTPDYVNLLKNCKELKTFTINNKLYIMSYRYLKDLDDMYTAYKGAVKCTPKYYSYEATVLGDEKTWFMLSLSDEDFKPTYMNIVSNGNEFTGDHLGVRAFDDENEFGPVNIGVKEIVNTIKNTTTDTYEQIRLANQMVCDRLSYRLTDSLVQRSIVGAFTGDGETVCQGYAETFKYIMDELGIPCLLISGSAGEGCHAWNEVYYNGEWKVVDTTWNDSKQHGNEKYLLVDLPETHRSTDVLLDDTLKLTYKIN